MKLKTLGCSGGIGAGLRTTSFLLDGTTLIDAGTGVCDLALEDLRGIRDIFITHSHLDHVGGIPLLVDTIFDALDTPLTLHGLPETLDALKTHMFNNVMWPDFSRIPNGDDPVMQYHAMRPGERVAVGDGHVEMLPVRHVIPAVGYYLQGPRRALAMSGDTTTNDCFWEALNQREQLDILVVEAAFPNREKAISELAYHYCPEALGADMTKLRHRPEVYITHLKPGDEGTIMMECRAAMPGRAVEPLVAGSEFEL